MSWRSTPPGPSCCPPAWRWWPTPTTSGTSRCSARTVRTPLFGVEVPVVAHRLAEPDKGTGIAMICTFGDITDVTWWRELQLPTRAIIGWDGRLLADPPSGLDSEGARTAYARLAGSTVHTARETVVEMLRESGELVGEPRPITHAVKFFEKGDQPLEIVTTRQWYLRNGGRDAFAARRAARARARAALAPGLHAAPVRELGRGTQRRLAGQPPAVLRRPVPGLVPAGRPTASRYDDPRSCRTSPRCRSTRSSDVPAGYTEDAARRRPAASSATRTSWTPGRRRR